MTSIWTEFNDYYEDKAVIGFCVECLKETIWNDFSSKPFKQMNIFLKLPHQPTLRSNYGQQKGYRLTIPKPKPLFLVDIPQHSVNKSEENFTHSIV